MPTSIEKLKNILNLEIERKYDNRAVVGGLDKILPSWKNEASAQDIDSSIIQFVSDYLVSYQTADFESRANIVRQLLTSISGYNQKSLPLSPVNKPENINPIQKPSSSTKNNPKPGNSHPRGEHTSEPTRFSDDPANIGINAPLTVLPGIGPRHAQTLENLNLRTLGDLLYFFPRRYDDYSRLKPISRLNYGDELTIIGTVDTISTRPVKNGKFKITEAVISDGSGSIRLSWFNQPWIENKLRRGEQIVLSGKVDKYLGRLIINNPEWELLEQEHLNTNRIVPVYPLTARINQRWLRHLMHQTITYWAPRIDDFLPQSIKQSANLLELSTAILQTHFPDSTEKLQVARSRLAFDEIFLLQMGVLNQKRTYQSATAKKFIPDNDWLESLITSLPYSLTTAQHKVLQDIRLDLGMGRPMNRLIQGDVGSGKTIVAMLAALMVTSSGDQVAYMAPTSILADQHYRNILNLINSNFGSSSGLNSDQVCLLIGDTSDLEKNTIYSGLSDGNKKMVIGTHALIEDPVQFKSLQLVIVDEQHRFGVAQRSTLRNKGERPHLLVMTATPIPRSLALTVYGDLDLSVMDEMPGGRQPIETLILHPLDREWAYQLIRNQVDKGYQAFIIYPLVEQGENEETKAAVEEYDRLQSEIYPNLKLGLLHGRLRPDEKEKVMLNFRSGMYQILVSTSVVEVGVDIPNATVMLVEGANRFGLAQLHQFRGRVGRGTGKSYCLLIPENENALENERLNAMAETNDGFILAEKDLEQRGPGEFLGTRQSGFNELIMADIMDVRLIEKARKHAQSLFEDDPDLADPNNHELAKMLRRFWSGGKGDIS